MECQSFFAEDFLALAVACLLLRGLTFNFAFLAVGFGNWTFAFAPLSLAQRAFAAALSFALVSAESFRRFCVITDSLSGLADG
ncbi:MAG: hypothetical protein J2P21_20360 [Chloracidobacterium sp.]|nr:hypothetical protein [Chloracidobacterium sp.]